MLDGEIYGFFVSDIRHAKPFFSSSFLLTQQYINSYYNTVIQNVMKIFFLNSYFSIEMFANEFYHLHAVYFSFLINVKNY